MLVIAYTVGRNEQDRFVNVESSEDDDKLHRLIEVAERGCHIRQLVRDDVPVNLKVTRL